MIFFIATGIKNDVLIIFFWQRQAIFYKYIMDAKIIIIASTNKI